MCHKSTRGNENFPGRECEPRKRIESVGSKSSFMTIVFRIRGVISNYTSRILKKKNFVPCAFFSYVCKFLQKCIVLCSCSCEWCSSKRRTMKKKYGEYMCKSAKPSQFLCHETGKNFFLEHTSRTSFFSIIIQYIMRNNSWTSQSGFVTTFFSTFSIKSDFFQLQEKCWKITLFQMPAILTGRIIQKF